MVSEDRWKRAQAYERGYWEGVAGDIDAGRVDAFSWYGWRADELSRWLGECELGHLTDGTAKVLEVGSGPVGLVNNFPGAERVAVDPLSDQYSSDESTVAARDPEVDHRQGMGEALPCEDSHYDLVIIENCIDHVRDVDAVMEEIARALTPSGVLYLTVNGRTPWWGYWMHRALSRLRLDPGHPHTFTPARARKLLRGHGFEIKDIRVGSAWEAHRDDLMAEGLRPKLKSVLGVSEYLISLIATRA